MSKYCWIIKLRNTVSIALAPHSQASWYFHAGTEPICFLRDEHRKRRDRSVHFRLSACCRSRRILLKLGRYSACVHGVDDSQIGGGLEFSPRLSRREVKRRTLDSVLKQLTTPSREQINRSHQVSFGWLIGRSVDWSVGIKWLIDSLAGSLIGVLVG